MGQVPVSFFSQACDILVKTRECMACLGGTFTHSILQLLHGLIQREQLYISLGYNVPKIDQIGLVWYGCRNGGGVKNYWQFALNWLCSVKRDNSTHSIN